MVAQPLASALLPTRNGELRICAFAVDGANAEHVALVKGDVSGADRVPTYIHSECLVGDALGSLSCDCRRRLDCALEWLGARDYGVVVYLRPDPQSLAVARRVRSHEPPAPAASIAAATDRGIASAILRGLGGRSALLVNCEGHVVETLAW